MLTVLTLLIAFCSSQYYNNYLSYSDNTCSSLVGMSVFSTTGPGAVPCFPVPTCNCSSGVCGIIQCNVTSYPALPANAIIEGNYNSTDCTGPVVTLYAAISGACMRDGYAGVSRQFSCSAGSFGYNTYTGSCTGTPNSTYGPYPIPGTSYCFYDSSTPNLGSSSYVCGAAKCFHEASTVTVLGKKMSLSDFKAADSPCAVPHELRASGLKIATTCPGVLRLTSEHLVMTPDGFRPAGSLKEGDRLYSKVHSDVADCTIVSIEPEVNQVYYGLNCEDGHVEADGYWVSTFGVQHSVPNAWMKLASKVFGIKTASRVGDRLSTFLHDWGFY